MADKQNNFGCIMYEDVFKRLSNQFDNESLGRVLRSAFNYGFYEIPVDLNDRTEEFACGMLTDIFDRNKCSYDERVTQGRINASIQHAKSINDLDKRLQEFGLAPHEISEARMRWRKQHPNSE